MSNECIDKRFEELIPAYEMGLLSEDDCKNLEQHALRCDSCFEKIMEFSDAAELLRKDKEVLKLVEAELVDPDNSLTITEKKKPFLFSRVGWRRSIPALLVGLVAIFLLVLQPWQIEIQPIKEAEAAENIIAIMYFQNLADADDKSGLSNIATNLLITDLSESKFLNVISTQRIKDIARKIGLITDDFRQDDNSMRLAQESGAHWLLLGSILQEQPSFVLTTQLINVSDGHVVASQRVQGAPEEDIFETIDLLTVQIKDDLSLPTQAKSENDPNVIDLTTHSPEAYKAYLAGVDYSGMAFNKEARASFELAISYDSTFAMAYYRLYNHVIGQQKSEVIATALKYADFATVKERLYIKSRAAWHVRNSDEAIGILNSIIEYYPQEKEAVYYLGIYAYTLGDYPQAIRYLQQTIDMDPYYKPALNQLAYAYYLNGDFNAALVAIDKFIDKTPDEPNGYDSKADFYLREESYEKAIEYSYKALKRKPDFEASSKNLAGIYIELGEYEKALKFLNNIAYSPFWLYQRTGIYGKANIAMFQGKFNKAMKFLDGHTNIDRDTIKDQGRIIIKAYAHFLKSKVLREKYELQKAIQEYETYEKYFFEFLPDDWPMYRIFYVELLLENGDFDKAVNFTEKMWKKLQQINGGPFVYLHSLGLIERNRGDLNKAIDYFEQARAQIINYHVTYMLGLCYYENGDYTKSIDILEPEYLHLSSWNAFNCTMKIKRLYYLGRCYEEIGNKEKAIMTYQRLINLWGNSDFPVKEVKEAKARLSELNR